MAQTKHSQGPWQKSSIKKHHNTGLYSVRIRSPFDGLLAIVSGNEPATVNANAGIVEAAPELLAVLKKMAIVIGKIKPDVYCEPVLMELYIEAARLCERIEPGSIL